MGIKLVNVHIRHDAIYCCLSSGFHKHPNICMSFINYIKILHMNIFHTCFAYKIKHNFSLHPKVSKEYRNDFNLTIRFMYKRSVVTA